MVVVGQVHADRLHERVSDGPSSAYSRHVQQPSSNLDSGRERPQEQPSVVVWSGCDDNGNRARIISDRRVLLHIWSVIALGTVVNLFVAVSGGRDECRSRPLDRPLSSLLFPSPIRSVRFSLPVVFALSSCIPSYHSSNTWIVSQILEAVPTSCCSCFTGLTRAHQPPHIPFGPNRTPTT